MGMLIEGRWTVTDASIQNGRFMRTKSAFPDRLDAGVVAALRAQPGRFYLIASLSCPWSHRTLIVRALKRLMDCVPLQIAGGPRIEGYALDGGRRWRVPGAGVNIRYLHELYGLAAADYTGRATVPVLWDSQACRIVSNESAEIMRAFDAADVENENAFTLAPPQLSSAIAALNERLYENLFNAVYRAGFAQRQSVYDEAVEQVFAALAELEQRLEDRRYLFGSVITETDWRLFATLARFDAVYYIHFKCSRRRLVDFPNLWAYARDLYAWRGIARTVDSGVIRDGYYGNDRDINPFGIAATPPAADWTAPHGRECFGAARLARVHGGEIEVEPATFEPLRGAAQCTH